MNHIENAVILFESRLEKKQLSENLTHLEALDECKEIIQDFRISLRPKPSSPVTIRGFIIDPAIFLNIRQRFLESEERLHGHKGDLLWMVGFQSLLGAGPAVLGQILLGGARNFLNPSYDAPPEALTFKNGAPFFSADLLVGIGASFCISDFGDIMNPGRGGRPRLGLAEGLADIFWKSYAEATTSIVPSLCSFRPGS